MATETPWISISKPNAGRLVLAEPGLVEADARLVQRGPAARPGRRTPGTRRRAPAPRGRSRRTCRPMPSAPARRAASRSQTLSPTTSRAAAPRRAGRRRPGTGPGPAWRAAPGPGSSSGCPRAARAARARAGRWPRTRWSRSPTAPRAGQRGEQFRARRAARVTEPACLQVLAGVRLLELRDVRRGQGHAGLPQQRGHEQAAAHPDPPVDPPHRQVDAEPGSAARQAITCWYTLSMSVPSRSKRNDGVGLCG